MTCRWTSDCPSAISGTGSWFPVGMSWLPCWDAMDCECERLFLDSRFYSLICMSIVMHFCCFLKPSGLLQSGLVAPLLCACGRGVCRKSPCSSPSSSPIARISPWGW